MLVLPIAVSLVSELTDFQNAAKLGLVPTFLCQGFFTRLLLKYAMSQPAKKKVLLLFLWAMFRHFILSFLKMF